MSSLEAIQAVRPEVRDLKPELDLAVIQTYELAQFYNLQELRMIQPIAFRDEGLNRIEPADVALVASAPIDRAPAADAEVDDTYIYPEACASPRAEFSREAGRSAAAAEANDVEHHLAPKDAGSATNCDSIAGASAAGEPAVLPYGGDVTRIRQLVDWIVTGREAVPVVFHYRQAGDLVEVQSPAARPIVSARQVTAVYKA